MRRFFRALRPDCGMAFLIVWHRGSGGADRSADLRAAIEPFPVASLVAGAMVEPGRATIVPEDARFALVGGRFEHCERAAPQAAEESPIDTLFAAIAIDQTENAAGIVLAGRGGDGAFGLRAIKENGGVTLVELPGECDAMLRGAIAAGLVEFVLPPEAMPSRLEDYFARRGRVDSRDSTPGVRADLIPSLPEIRALVSEATGHDLTGYADDAVHRRLARRMNILAIDDVRSFIERLRQDPNETRAVFRDLMISVTNFFREPPAFAALARDVVPRLFEGKGPDDAVRVWVPACASGEEAYSIAILLEEQRERASYPPELQIFATDVKEGALEVARAGRYSASIASDVSPERLERYFEREDGAYRVVERLRRICQFSAHDLLADPPFSALDLISCRNLLVYLRAEVRDRVVALFHHALLQGGTLFLGAPDSPPHDPRLFVAEDALHQIFRRRGSPGGETFAEPSGAFCLPSPPLRD